MTLRLLLWVITLTATVLVSQIQPRFFSPTLIIFIALLGPFSYFWDRFQAQLVVRPLERDDLVTRGDEAYWQVRITNRSRMQTHFLKTRYTAANAGKRELALSLEPKQEAVLDLRVDTRHCGVQPAPSLDVSHLGLFGLFRQPLARGIEDSLTPVYILPGVSEELDAPSVFGDLMKLGQLQAIGRETNHDEVDHSRAMQPGDAKRLIHWKLSARLQDWMVRQFSKAQEKSVHILLELPSLEDGAEDDMRRERDRLLERVAQEIRTFLYHDFQVTLVTQGRDTLVQTFRGLDRFDSFRKQLAIIAPVPSVPLAAQLGLDFGDRRMMIFYLAAPSLDQDFLEAIKELRRASSGVLLELLLREPLSDPQKQMIQELRTEGVEVFVSESGGDA